MLSELDGDAQYEESGSEPAAATLFAEARRRACEQTDSLYFHLKHGLDAIRHGNCSEIVSKARLATFLARTCIDDSEVKDAQKAHARAVRARHLGMAVSLTALGCTVAGCTPVDTTIEDEARYFYTGLIACIAWTGIALCWP